MARRVAPGMGLSAGRTWLAIVLSLFIAFWLQLESASSAAVTVAILAQPTRGQAFTKAVYRCSRPSWAWSPR